MVRSRKSTERKIGTVSDDDMKTAVQMVLGGRSIRSVCKDTGIGFSTLRRYVFKANNCEDLTNMRFSPNYECRQVFIPQEENLLRDYLIIASKIHFGLSPKQVRSFAFEYAMRNNKTVPPSWIENQCAGEDWFSGFMKRYPDLSLRRPEATSLSRATSFNKTNVSAFFKNLEDVQRTYKFSPQDIYNCDETGCSTVQKVSNERVVASCKDKQVGKVTSGEKGTLVTMLSTINAAGNSIPPFLVFPRVHFKNTMISGAPPGTIGVAHPSGWMTADNFFLYMEHFIKSTKCSKERPVLLILDNHETHLSLKTIDLAREKGVVMLTLPPHCSHKLQPLDVAVYGPFKGYYNQASNAFMVNSPGQTITIHDIAGIVGNAYPLAFTPKNIVSGFRVTGICPFNPNVFSEEEFLCAYVTDRPENSQSATPSSTATATSAAASTSSPTSAVSTLSATSSATSSSTSAVSTSSATSSSTSAASTSSATSSSTSAASTSSATSSSTSAASTSSATSSSTSAASTSSATSSSSAVSTSSAKSSTPGPQVLSPASANLTPEAIRPFPKAPPRKTKGGRKRGATLILTSSPVKRQLQLNEEEKMRKRAKQSVKTKKAKTVPEDDTDDDDDDENSPPVQDSSDDDDFFEDEDIETVQQILEPELDEVKTDDFVLIEFPTKKINVVYAGQILSKSKDIETNDTLFEVKFLRREKPTCFSFIFPQVEDIAEVNFEQVVGKLPRPQAQGGTARVARHFTFPVDFSLYAEALR